MKLTCYIKQQRTVLKAKTGIWVVEGGKSENHVLCIKPNHEHSCVNPFEKFEELMELGSWMVKSPERKFRKMSNKIQGNMMLGTVLRLRCADESVNNTKMGRSLTQSLF